MPAASSGAASATVPSPWSRERSRALVGQARDSLASGSGRWTLPQPREQAMARADPARAELTVRCAIYTRKSSDEGLEGIQFSRCSAGGVRGLYREAAA